ncbi:unnamed protein product [Rotaria sordida]|uniref:Uncharacterized protein n=1 Tax=Rotaria sordida TaxID=392033 RepID=A0A819C5K3_9BILA|nr:unnamed protein product [Rotaria sordida]
MNQNEEQHHVIKYILDKLEKYAHKSDLWRLIHASHLRRNLLRRSERVSKIYSISEDLVRQCINQIFADVDQYVTQLHRLIYSQQFDDLIPIFSNANKKNTLWHTMQIERARHLCLTQEQLTENELLENYYTYIREKLTPKNNILNENQKCQFRDSSFDLNLAYTQAEKTNIDQWTWLLEQWRDMLRTMPMICTQAGAFSRLVRTTIGIGLMYLGKSAETMVTTGCLPMNTELINEQLFNALQIGFYFGVAYAVVDCLQDEIHNLDNIPLHHFLIFDNDTNHILTPVETIDKWLYIMEQFLSGTNFDRSQLPKTPFTSMLIESFDNLLILTKSNNIMYESFNELALLLRSQRIDKKEIDQYYDDEQLYLGSVLKSHFTYTCTTHLADMSTAREESEHLWIIPFLGQLTDDCRDFNDDIKSKSVTPFTYYASLIRHKQPIANSLLNPFNTFLNLCSDIYLSSNRDSQTGAFLGRRIARALRSIEVTGGETSFIQFLNIFCSDNRLLYDYCWHKLRKQFPIITDPEKTFFRLLDVSSIKYARINRKLETYVCENIIKIEDALNILPLHSQGETIVEEEVLISAMNYSVKVGGKRLRPLLMQMVADLYEIEPSQILPLTCGIEYLHTSSLIFDDLPAQDNSDLRRGQPSLHKTIINNDIPFSLCEGRAQLAAVDLIAISMGLINHGLIRNGFLPECVNRVVSEISMLMHDLCIGQMMDLRAARVGIGQDNRQIDKLDRIAWFKTGKTIEAVMIMPVILANPPSDEQAKELLHIRELSRLMGIMFQMRDDLLDVEGGDAIGKPTLLDIKNNTVTYVSLLGIDATRHRLQQFLTQALQLVDDCWPIGSETIKDVIKYIVARKT